MRKRAVSAVAASPRIEPKQGSCLSLLSNRESQVVRGLVEGRTNRQIADALGISQHTVKSYIFKIYAKLGIANRAELVVHVLGQLQSSGEHPAAVSKSSELREEECTTEEGRQAPRKFVPPSQGLGTAGRGLHEPQAAVKKVVGS